MGEISKIEWCDATWNPWQGCHKISKGCDNCYMHADKKRFGKNPSAVVRSTPVTFNAPLKWHKKMLKEGKNNMRVFTCSWSDFFIEEADAGRNDAWNIIRDTPNITYLILTKRIRNVFDRLPKDFSKEFYAHVWLGVTVENQEQADKRIPELLRLKGLYPWLKVFISIEPMLGAVDLQKYLWHSECDDIDCNDDCTIYQGKTEGLDWVIVGGENGAGARPMHPDWASEIRDQCKEAAVPFFFKGWGQWFPRSQWEDNPYFILPYDEDCHDNDPMIRIIEDDYFHKIKNSGALLDGVEHKEVSCQDQFIK